MGGKRFDGVSVKKQGFTFEDRDLFEEVARKVGLIRRDDRYCVWCRHPLAFLVEAADDISYRVIDIEDGFRLGYFGYDEVVDLFWPILANPEQQAPRISTIRDPKNRVQLLRAKVINAAIIQARDCFLDNETDILAGRFDTPLLDKIPLGVEMDRLVDVARERIYRAPEVVEIQAAGYQVISDLLEYLCQVIDDIAERGDRASPRSQTIARLVPDQFLGGGRKPAANAYLRLLRLTDFISGMTDSYAVSLYKKITGISLPGG